DTFNTTGGKSLIQYFEDVSAALNKPLLFTEIGYNSAPDAASQPFFTSSNTYDPQLQTLLYQAFFQAWKDQGNTSLQGVYIWEWEPNPNSVGAGVNPSWTPQGSTGALQAVDAAFTAAITTAPAPSALALLAASDSGIKGDNVTNITTPTITGSGEVGDTLNLFDGVTAAGSTTVGAGGTWSVTTSALASGGHSLTATERNAGGTVSGASSPLVLRIDTTTPTTTAASLTVAVDSGPTAIGIAAPADSDDSASALTVTVAGLPSDGTVLLSDGATAVALNQALSVTQLTGLEFRPTAGLSAASSTFTYTVTDPAGNGTGGSATLTIQSQASTYDATAPLMTNNDGVLVF